MSRAARATLVVLRPATKDPGFLARRFLVRDAERITAPTPRDLAERAARVLEAVDAVEAFPDMPVTGVKEPHLFVSWGT